MISRVAESCFWLERYIERCDSTARLLEVNLHLLLDVRLPAAERWHPLLIAAGEEERFYRLYGRRAVRDDEFVQNYLSWDEANPASILSAGRWARENARVIRETLSLEAWETINAFWLWLSSGPGKRLYQRDRAGFYAKIKHHILLIRAVCQDTMLHERPFDFLRLGMALERAGQTARMLDVKYLQMGPARSGSWESADELTLWLAVLRSSDATEAFFKRGYPLEGESVARFLIFDPAHPRAIRHNLDRCWNFLRRVRPVRGRGYRSARLLRALRRKLPEGGVEDVLEQGIHPFLTEIVDGVSEVGEALNSDFFDLRPAGSARTRL